MYAHAPHTLADFLVFECILLVLSECGVPKKFFELFLPVLGPAHGLGVLGALQCLCVLILDRGQDSSLLTAY